MDRPISGERAVHAEIALYFAPKTSLPSTRTNFERVQYTFRFCIASFSALLSFPALVPLTWGHNTC